MQRSAIVFLFCLALSCKSKTSEENVTKPAQWEVVEKMRYDYRLNSVGKPDTIFIYTYNYKGVNLIDSSIRFQIHKYSGDFLTERKDYKLDKNNNPTEENSIKYAYTKARALQSVTLFSNGELVRDDQYFYNDSNRLIKQVLIRSRKMTSLLDESSKESQLMPVNIGVTDGYDTITNVFKYDNMNKVIGAIMTDTHGKVLRNDINIYSGNDPLATISTDAKGDTLQSIDYKVDGNSLHSKIENDSLLLLQTARFGLKIAQTTIVKSRKERWRRTITYDKAARKTTETLYKAI